MNRYEEDARDSGHYPPDEANDGKAEWECSMYDWATDMKVHTHYNPKPIPTRDFDWFAAEDNYDLGSPAGWGATEAEAIADLKEQLESDSE